MAARGGPSKHAPSKKARQARRSKSVKRADDPWVMCSRCKTWIELEHTQFTSIEEAVAAMTFLCQRCEILDVIQADFTRRIKQEAENWKLAVTNLTAKLDEKVAKWEAERLSLEDRFGEEQKVRENLQAKLDAVQASQDCCCGSPEKGTEHLTTSANQTEAGDAGNGTPTKLKDRREPTSMGIETAPHENTALPADGTKTSPTRADIERDCGKNPNKGQGKAATCPRKEELAQTEWAIDKLVETLESSVEQVDTDEYEGFEQWLVNNLTSATKASNPATKTNKKHRRKAWWDKEVSEALFKPVRGRTMPTHGETSAGQESEGPGSCPRGRKCLLAEDSNREARFESLQCGMLRTRLLRARYTPNLDTTCPLCTLEDESIERIVLHCPALQPQRPRDFANFTTFAVLPPDEEERQQQLLAMELGFRESQEQPQWEAVETTKRRLEHCGVRICGIEQIQQHKHQTSGWKFLFCFVFLRRIRVPRLIARCKH
ncbi:hypothetical protein HPB52_006625 [Rhipicephalus sanguineus]|uniref:Uncharacterized protein n=1 Tax=Rhipicephalus sanguineus TaxID=34632 RepID=A0A9D4T8V8_RHISA|nr:hypothetical protein HPB52_006625 [Rhipicephalus sanguineus]